MQNPAGAVEGNSQNMPTANVPRTRSTFPLSYHLFDTHRFGEYHPHYVEDSVKTDTLPIRSSHEVRSYTLKSPLMQSITMHKDYFSVPAEAILPNNWEKFFDNPVRGDDVLDDVGPTVANFWTKVQTFMNSLHTALTNILADSTTTTATTLQAIFRYLIIGEYFYSNGSLMSSLGCHGAPYVTIIEAQRDYRSWDYLFDKFLSTIVSSFTDEAYFRLTVDGYTYQVYKDTDTSGIKTLSYGGRIDIRHALALMRDNPVFTITAPNLPNTFKADINQLFGSSALGTPAFLGGNIPFNTSRLWAYQLCCAHYYSNDHIDFVYSADLFRQLIGNYLSLVNWSLSTYFFIRNGVRYQYDYLSAYFCNRILALNNYASTFLTSDSSYAVPVLGYLSALFGYRRSLRYQDYFTGSRAQPLAVGSTGVTVSNNTVDVIDVTRNIQRQRFLNAVNRVRHNFEGYLQGIFGGNVPAPDYHNPFFLSSTKDTIFGQETENTGAAQVSNQLAITSNLRSNGSRYMFEVNSDRPCIIIGITHYDLPRVYTKTIERSYFHQNRFDMFNPFMQFTGDQPVYLQELGVNVANSSTLLNFAYSLKYMEYKQRYNQAAGGFVENLPGFAFLALDERGSQATINPDWIRSVPSEFDNFFVSLTGYSNGSYFHFIVDTFNDCSGSRPMAYAPSIL